MVVLFHHSDRNSNEDNPILRGFLLQSNEQWWMTDAQTAGRDEGPGEMLGSCPGWLALLWVGTGCMDLRAQFLTSRSHSLLFYCYYYSYCLDKKSPHAVEVKAGNPFLSVPRDPRTELSFLNRHRQLRLHLVAELRVFDLPSFQDSSCPVPQQQLPPTEAWGALLIRVSPCEYSHL